VLTRLTGALAAAFFVICLVVGLFNRSEERGASTGDRGRQIQQKFFEPIKRDVPTAATPAPEKPARDGRAVAREAVRAPCRAARSFPRVKERSGALGRDNCRVLRLTRHSDLVINLSDGKSVGRIASRILSYTPLS